MTGRVAIVADKVFDGSIIHTRAVVRIDDEHIEGLLSPFDLKPGETVVRLPPGTLLSPGFVDIHVNGGGGALLNDEPTIEGIRTIAETHRRFGTTGLLPTLISDTRDVVRRAIDAVALAVDQGIPGVLGIHLEGPFLNPARKGVHPASHLTVMKDGDIDLLSSLGARGLTVVTLAPECVPAGTIRELSRRGVLVCAGHTEATAEELEAALDEGLAGFTHLFNAMSQLGSRAPGAVGTALTDDRTYAGIIPDGHHVADRSLRLAYKAKGHKRLIIVSDAMPPVGTALDRFTLLGTPIFVRDGCCVTEDGTLAGAAIDMAGAVRHMVHRVGVPLDHALAMASRTPAEFLKQGTNLGSIEPGRRANLVALDPRLEVLATWIDGVSVSSR